MCVCVCGSVANKELSQHNTKILSENNKDTEGEEGDSAKSNNIFKGRIEPPFTAI